MYLHVEKELESYNGFECYPFCYENNRVKIEFINSKTFSDGIISYCKFLVEIDPYIDTANRYFLITNLNNVFQNYPARDFAETYIEVIEDLSKKEETHNIIRKYFLISEAATPETNGSMSYYVNGELDHVTNGNGKTSYLRDHNVIPRPE